jgi:hypothetical protein
MVAKDEGMFLTLNNKQTNDSYFKASYDSNYVLMSKVLSS